MQWHIPMPTFPFLLSDQRGVASCAPLRYSNKSGVARIFNGGRVWEGIVCPLPR